MFQRQITKSLLMVVSLSLFIVLVSSRATPRSSSPFNLTQAIHDKVDCANQRHIIDECGLQQGFSFRVDDFGYPLDQASLQASCKRQTDAFKCLRLYAKCQQPLTKQILLALVNTRTRYNKKLCTEKPSEFSQRFLEMNNCMAKSGLNIEKGPKAEYESISLSETIIQAKVPNLSDRLKYSCCSVAQVKKEFMESTRPHCSQHSRTFGDLIDSYLSETVGIICPNFDSGMKECEKLPKLTPVKKVNARYFVLPILDVIDTLS